MFNRKKTTFLSLIAMSFILVFTSACKKVEVYDLDTNNDEALVESSFQSEDVINDDSFEEPTEEVDEDVTIIEDVIVNETEEDIAIVFEDLEWKKYNNNLLGYSIDYPTITSVTGDDLDQYVEFVGPLSNNEWWPRISIAHYSNDFYRPGEETSVSEWFKPFPGYELGEQISIAGLETLHYKQAKSPQAFAADYYYFIKDNQLYNINIIHSNDKQDWELYNKILESFQFTKLEEIE